MKPHKCCNQATCDFITGASDLPPRRQMVRRRVSQSGSSNYKIRRCPLKATWPFRNLSHANHDYSDAVDPSRLDSVNRGPLQYDSVLCPLCGQRKARRNCPALGQQICAVCCGTKRLVEIQCPETCPYLSAAREHPPAATLRRRQADVGAIIRAMQDLNDRQSQLFLLAASFLVNYEPPALQGVVDDDVTEAMGALAGTFETASRGVIYEHRPASLPAERLANALKPLLNEARGQGAGFDRDAAVVCRRIEAAAREAAQDSADNRRAFLDLLGRVISREQAEAPPSLIP